MYKMRWRERNRMWRTGQSSLPLVLLLTSNLERTVVNKTSLHQEKHWMMSAHMSTCMCTVAFAT